MVTRRVFCIGLLALSLTGMGSPIRAAEDLKEIRLLVQGMTWPQTWPERVRRALEGLPGVKKADVNFYTAKAVVRYDPSQVSAEDMIRAVQKAGFKCTVAPPS